MRLPQTDSTPSQTPAPYKPLTDPAELLTLLGRVVICFVLAALTISLLVKQQIAFALFVGAISLFVQRITIKMWRRMRDERQEAEAALLARAASKGEAAP